MSNDDYSKECSNCKKRKPASKFSKRTASKDGLMSWCKACRNAYDKERHVKLGTCSLEGCDKKEFRKALCNEHYYRGLHGDCQQDGCGGYARGPHGLCVHHRDSGTCERHGCDQRVAQAVDGVKLCKTHTNNAKGVHTPRGESLADKPFRGYIVEDEWGFPAYVGITCRSIEDRMAQHRREADWYHDGLVMPTEAEEEFDNKADAEEWERETIHQLAAEGNLLYNMTHNMEQYTAVRDVVLDVLSDLIPKSA